MNSEGEAMDQKIEQKQPKEPEAKEQGNRKGPKSAEEVVDWEYREKAKPLIQELKEKGFQIVLLEQTVRSLPYQEFTPQKPVCLVIGNEVTGVEDDLLPDCDHAIEIEMAGVKNSLNVTVAFGVVAYHFRHQLLIPVAP